MPTTTEVDEIRRKMAEIRMDMHREISGVRAGTEAATSWTYYVKHYPWASLALAFALGYLIVPRRREELKVIVPNGEAVEPKAERRRKKGLIALALGFLGPIAVRAAQGYAVNYLDTLMAQNTMAGPGEGAPEASPPHAGHPGSTIPPGPGMTYPY